MISHPAACAALVAVLAAAPATAHMILPPETPPSVGDTDLRTVEGPSEAKGVKVHPAGAFPLDRGAAALPGFEMRVRYFEIAPGGIVPVHNHDDRPAVVIVTMGEIVEHRSDQAEPVTIGPGEVSLEAPGITHWFENVSDETLHGYGVDLNKSE
jgi:quercetin dioxygenase-like cupin family protein